MKRIINLSIVLVVTMLLTSSLFAQSGQGNGNGFRGNGINPNPQWVDLNGDGICDNFGAEAQGKSMKGSKMFKNNGNPSGLGLGNGHGDGSGIRPQDGTGFGKGNGGGLGNGTGVCDGSGPKGKRQGNK
jgi:hypothetical protein